MLKHPEIIVDFHKEIENDINHRYKSWEHCYTAFQKSKDVDFLCLHLGFYLASWGMYRGSAGLLQKDYRIHQEAVEILISEKYYPLRTWEREFSKQKIDLLINLIEDLKKYYGDIDYTRGSKEYKLAPTDTLISKIILGSLGCIPAYDRYFNDGLKDFEIPKTMGKKSLTKIMEFIEANEEELIQVQIKISTVEITYPMMKIVDMYFWMLGNGKS